MPDTMKKISNTTLTHPVTGEKIVQLSNEKGEPTIHWSVNSALCFILEQQQVKNVETMMRSLDLLKKVKAQEKDSSIVVTKNEYIDIRASADAFSPFLQKGVLFSALYVALRDAEDVETEAPKA